LRRHPSPALETMTLAADRVVDQAWRAGIGVAAAVVRAGELSDPLRGDAVMRTATLVVSNHQACSADDALSRLVFVSQLTARRVQEIAAEVVASDAAAAQEATGALEPHPYRFTL
jgi:hypothetical protein